MGLLFDILKSKVPEYRLKELRNIQSLDTSESFKMKELLYFIAEELVLINQERRKK